MVEPQALTCASHVSTYWPFLFPQWADIHIMTGHNADEAHFGLVTDPNKVTQLSAIIAGQRPVPRIYHSFLTQGSAFTSTLDRFFFTD
jgi:hypothetical protein